MKRLSIVSEGAGVHPTQVHTQITISRYPCIDYSHEFVGSALARFERSTLPDHNGTRSIVLRFLKIITPVKCVDPLYDGFVGCPEERELYRRNSFSDRKKHHVWSINIDKPSTMQRGLQLLWGT
jgi:hypothetical protein